jgi:hypothetical protein
VTADQVTVTADPVTVTPDPVTVTQPAPPAVTVTVTATPVATTPASTSASPTPTPPPTTTTTTPPPVGAAWPDASNTGTPDGVTLTPYPGTGACNITTPNVVLDARVFNCDVVVKVAGVKITRSKLNGRLIANTDNNPTAAVVVTDSTIDGQAQETFPTVSYTNITLDRVEVIGGQHSVQCSANCTVTNSWLHDQFLPRASAGHVNAFISNGGHDFVLRHNTLHCTALPTNSGGCTADASFFGDFGPIANVTLDNNLFKARSDGAGYCLQAGWNPGKKYPNPTNVKVTNNVFERGPNNQCGIYGPVTAFKTDAPGAVWTGNVWDNGGPVNP